MDKTGSNRHGWNERGYKPIEQVRTQQRIDFHRAHDLADELADIVGVPAYDTWIDDVYSDRDTISWRALGDMMQAKIDELNSAECDHKLPGEICQHCAPKLPADEIPYAKDML